MRLTVDAETLKRFIAFSKAFVGVAKIVVGNEMRMRAVDSGNICLTDVFIPESAIEANGDAEFVIDLGKAYSAVKNFSGKVIAEVNANAITFSSGSISYSLKLIDTPIRTPKIPELNFTARAEVPGEEFRKLIQIASRISDHLVFETENGDLMVKTKDASESLTYTFPYSRGDDARTAVGSEYLKAISKLVSKTDVITISVGKDIPLRISIEPEGMEVSYYIAPRVEVR